MKFALPVIIAVSTLATGCAYNSAPYGASRQNVEKIKTAKIPPVSVGTFSAATPGQSSITCRAAGPVTVKPSFAGYIQEAFTDELKLAGAYDANAKTVLSGKLDEVDFSSGITDGKWRFKLTLSNNKSQSFTTESVFPFSGSFVADKACQEVAQAFSPAVQKLIEDVIQNPQFRALAN